MEVLENVEEDLKGPDNAITKLKTVSVYVITKYSFCYLVLFISNQYCELRNLTDFKRKKIRMEFHLKKMEESIKELWMGYEGCLHFM